MTGLILLVLFFVFVMPLLILLAVVGEYVICGIALSRIAKQTEACKPSQAWIPVWQYKVLGKCAEACHAKTEKSGKKSWNWGKILLILCIVYYSCMIFVMPFAVLLSFFGLGIFVDAILLLGAVFNVAMAVCAFKIYRFYMEDPYDIIVLILTTMYPGWTSTALLITSFLKPRAKDSAPQKSAPQKSAPQESENDGAAVIDAEETP